jgi:ribosome maturation factor RimP
LSANRLEKLLQPLVEDLGYEFVGLEYSSSPRHAVLRVYIDHEDGVDIDDCSRVSHEVAALLDVEDPISGQYNLEISSPGLDRPLFTREQYRRFTGEEVQVTLYAPEAGRRKFKGRIIRVEGDCLVLEQDGAEVALNFNNIARARLVPDYDKLMSGQGGRQA